MLLGTLELSHTPGVISESKKETRISSAAAGPPCSGKPLSPRGSYPRITLSDVHVFKVTGEFGKNLFFDLNLVTTDFWNCITAFPDLCFGLFLHR